MQRQAQDSAAAFAQIQAHQDELQRQQLEFQRQQFEMHRQQAATQQQYLELMRQLVTVGVLPPPSVLTLALQSSGPQSQGQPISVHLSSAAGIADVSVSELHAYPDRIYSTSSAGTTPPLRPGIS
jgi:hypothetical protein